MADSNETTLRIEAYHQRTKHHFQRYAAGPNGLDWQNQPNPFRTFKGCDVIKLPLTQQAPDVLYRELYLPGTPAKQAITLATIAQLFEFSLGLSAWKSYDDSRWALRCNPSSGNLHPTEAYVVVPDYDDISRGVYHYVSRDHALEKRCTPDKEAIFTLPSHGFLLGLSSIFWREAWKYGERAYRYCQHDVGHAIAAIRYAAGIQGWQATVIDTASDTDVSTLLGLNRDQDFVDAEREHPDVLLWVTPDLAIIEVEAHSLEISELAANVKKARWVGQANQLSMRHGHQWQIIEEACKATVKPSVLEERWQPSELPKLEFDLTDSTHRASALIQQRRSAQAFDGSGRLSESAFYQMLDLLLTRPKVAPMDTIPWASKVHLLLFVHRVENVEPGLYLFLRQASSLSLFQAKMKADFDWQKPEGCPEHLPLYHLQSGDARSAAKSLSCDQEIASDGVISFGMLAEFRSVVAQKPWQYRQLFWEAGMLGQILYLEAEAMGFRGTGIGCYFDDGVHDLLGLEDTDIQSLYHFTIGVSLEDTRLQTLPPYAHLQGA
ncbi:MAG: nitroreductase [Methylococcales bacterium]|jgi:SagB-type dehydrogenase family enzyme|nr:nitroreductase [Methylococcales bacterium]MBT7445468.1 nitroreductase [Methylococcales bacterium]